MNADVDIVVMWVDGNDPKWQEEKRKYEVNKNADGSVYRYRDWDLLEYWFRGIEKFAPWVRKIHFVTWGHLPEWLNTNHPKLNIIKHEDFIPKEYLPTFSANTIELNIHRIKDLAENFILFNDDVYLIKDTKRSDFFKGNIPKDTVALNVHCPKKSLVSQYFCINDVNIINEHFDFKKSIKENFFKWFNIKSGSNVLRTIILLGCPRFPGFWQHHLANAYNLKTYETVWEKEPEILHTTCTHRFRETTDVNQWVFKEWQIASGNFEPRNKNFGKSYYIDRDGIQNIKKELLNNIVCQNMKIISINDGPMSDEEFDTLILDLKKSFQKIMPEKSKYEK